MTVCFRLVQVVELVGPDYERPDLVTPDAWHSDLKAGLEASSEGVGSWWDSFEATVRSWCERCWTCIQFRRHSTRAPAGLHRPLALS